MHASRAILSLSILLLPATPVFAELVNYEMVTVANPGNAYDTGGTAQGTVAYEYQIGKYAVTIGQYTAFLNAADPNGSNPNGIYNASMGTNLNIAGISYTSEAIAGAKYSVIINGGVSGNRPVTYVSWFDAARFANWMTNGQGSGSTETGAYTLNNATAGDAVTVNAGAAFYIPTDNEWYKAAYYSPVKGGVGSPGYYAYATQSDTAPGNIIGSGANQANYYAGNFAVTQSSDYSESQNYLTDVGAFSNSASFYGTFDQSGNLAEWLDQDSNWDLRHRRFRGGNWASFAFGLSSSDGRDDFPSHEYFDIGFRLASPVPVPEPSTLVMGLAGIACGGWQMYRRRRAR